METQNHCTESDKPYLMYRTTIEMTSTTQTINMPESWFPYLVSDVCIHMNPFKHFGSGWGEMLDGSSILFFAHSTSPSTQMFKDLAYWISISLICAY